MAVRCRLAGLSSPCSAAPAASAAAALPARDCCRGRAAEGGSGSSPPPPRRLRRCPAASESGLGLSFSWMVMSGCWRTLGGSPKAAACCGLSPVIGGPVSVVGGLRWMLSPCGWACCCIGELEFGCPGKLYRTSQMTTFRAAWCCDGHPVIPDSTWDSAAMLKRLPSSPVCPHVVAHRASGHFKWDDLITATVGPLTGCGSCPSTVQWPMRPTVRPWRGPLLGPGRAGLVPFPVALGR